MSSAEDNSLLDNPKYRQYMSAIDKALRGFESSSEWADLISALGKLNKVLNPKFKLIPKKITIGKRLAQCMHPALPGGVHLKALDVYNSIFKIIETEHLKTDLYIYAMGVFPLLANASMQVRPVLLNLYETHFLPLDEALSSCLDGMLLGLLPGLEEGTEHFQRTDALLDRVCGKVGKLEFFGAVWRCILSSSIVRLFAVQLIIRRFDKAKSTDDQLYIIGPDVFVMVHALRESLQDNSVLTQRASLDVLILCCPFSNIPISRHDCCELLLAALQCLLRRDMSLNRRLYSWLLGHDLAKRLSSASSADHDDKETFFDDYSKELLTDAILQILVTQRKKIANCEATKQVSILEELYPFRILISLLDKPEIGPIVIEALLLDVFRLLKAAVDFVKRKYDNSQTSSNDEGVDNKAVRLSEISKTANLLLGVFEPAYIWQFLSQQLHHATTQKRDSHGEADVERQPVTSYAEVCNLTCLLLRVVNVESYQEIQTCHLPNLLYDVISSLVNSLPQFSTEELKLGLDTCNVLLDLIQPVQSDEIVSSMNEIKSEMISKSSSKEMLLSNSNRHSSVQRDVSQCSDLFNDYFCSLIELKFSCDRDSISRCVSNLEIKEEEQGPGVPKPPLNEHGGSHTPSHQPCTDDVMKCGKYTKKNELVEIFKLTCQLMLDFACFPIFCNGQACSTADERENKVSISRFPQWLKCLLWCICDCYSPVTSFFEIPSTSVSTMLDLVSLATSVARKKRPSKQDDSCAGTVSVVVLSPMSYFHVCVLTERTKFYQHVTEKLWQIMADSKSCGHHLTCVQLLIRLHSMCPDDRCENVLLEYIMNPDKEVRIKALAQFCRFWHFTKTLLSKKATLQTGGHFRNFNRCLFAVIDALSHNNNPSYILSPLFRLNNGGTSVAMSIASSWLNQCLEERDLVRILEPLLMVALHPRTHSSQLRPPEGTDVSSLAAKSAGKEVQDEVIPSSSSRTGLSRPSDESIHNITSNVMLEIAKGKELYKELISSLTSLNHKETEEQQLELRVKKIVNDVVQSAIEKVILEKPTEECKEDDAESVSSDVMLPDASTLQPVLEENIDTFSTFHSVKNFSKLKSNKHMLVYQENFDSARALYTLRSISTLLHAHPRLFTYAAVTSQLSSYTSQLAGGGLLQDLLARHLQVLSGRSFYEDVASRSQSMMVIDVLIVVCLHFIRSWHPEDTISPESLHDIRCSASSLLCSLLTQITEFTRETLSSSSSMMSSPIGSSIGVTSQHIGPFVRSVLSKYGVSEIVLASLATTVEALNMLVQDDSDSLEPRRVKVARASMTSLDDVKLAFWWSGNDIARVRSFQCHLLALVRALVVLEHLLTDTEIPSTKDVANDSKHSQLTPTTYRCDGPVATQPLLTTSLIRMLRLQSACEVHPAWLDFLTSSLTYLARALPELTAPVTSQLCKNLEFASGLYIAWDDQSNASATAQIPADYMVMLLKSLRTLTHFTLLLQSGSGLQHPFTSAVSHLSKVDRVPAPTTSTTSSQASNNIAFSAFGSFLNVFTNNNSLKTQRSIEEQVLSADWTETRRTTLRNLPRILSCLAIVWDKVVSSKSSSIAVKKNQDPSGSVNPCVALGDGETVSQNVLQILDPLSVQYGENLLSAFAIVWERRGRGSPKHQDTQPVHPLSEQQSQLLSVACSIRALHCDVTLTLVKRVIVQPPELPSLGSGKKKKIPFEEYLIDFSLHFLQRQTPSALRESWSSLLSLLRECIAFGPVGTSATSNTTSSAAGSNPTSGGKRVLTARCYFLLLLIVAEYVKRVPPFDDKKDQKDLQEVCVKCIEACNTIVDRSLEHGGWLARRAPSVLPGPQPTTASFTHRKRHAPESDSSLERLDHLPNNRDQVHVKHVTSDPVLLSKNEPPNSLPLTTAVLPQTFNQHYNSSVQSLNVLSQVLANLLDVIYGSEEKDKSVPVLTPVMTNVTPYLRNHSLKSIPSYRAAVCFLSSISGYQQTRRAWKRDAFELFLASDFFQMPMENVTDWRNIVDHLMTHDSTTFKDLMVRIGLTRNAATGTSLNIFSNKEQELEQRAMLLKRLAFVIFSSGLNQYQRHLPEIQERLSESLRLHQVPVVQEQVFLCFRVLLLRVSPNHLTSLWPSIITELVQVMGQMEQELLHYDLDKTVAGNEPVASPKPNKSNASTPTSGVGIIFNSTPSPSSINNQEKWLAMYLSACKLLDLTLLLQPNQLTHFKMFRWSFVGEPGEVTDDACSTNDVSTRATPVPNASEKNTDQQKETTELDSPKQFVPHCVRIKRLLAEKVPGGKFDTLDVAPVRPLLKRRRMTSLFQLQAFFNTIVSPGTMLSMHQGKVASAHSSLAEEPTISSPTIEKLLERDFVEVVPS